MKRTRLRNLYLKKKTVENKTTHNKQRYYCVSLLQKTKRNYYANLNEKNVVDTKKLWRANKPDNFDKVKPVGKIILVEGDKLLMKMRETLRF